MGRSRSRDARRAARSRGLRARVVVAVVPVIIAATVASTSTPSASAGVTDPRADAVVRWRPPVGGPVVRPFVAPTSAYGPGHRGVDYATASGAPVTAAGRGAVVFAGDVAGARHVVVLHGGGLRTSYSFLLDTTVTVGQAVEAGTLLGHAGGPDPDGEHSASVVHFGLRVGERYVDPSMLFRPVDLREHVRLVPVDGDAARDAAWAHRAYDESAGLLVGLDLEDLPGPATAGADGCGPDVPVLGAAIDAACAAVDWAAAETAHAFAAGMELLRSAGRTGRLLVERIGPALDRLRHDVAQAGAALRAQLLDTPFGRVLSDVVEIGARFLEWTRRECSTHASPADGTGGSGNVVMAVGGIDSASSRPNGRSFGLDVDALGYDEADVRWYSYAADGGAYTAEDTHGDLRVAAKRLAAQLRAAHAADPGRSIDLIAHSQGGVVVDRFLRFEYDASDPTFPPLGAVVTLASPHRGAPLASSVADLRDNRKTRRALDAVDALGGLGGLGVPTGPPSDAISVRQLAEDSPFMRRLHAAPLPDGIDITTIGGTDDVVVPANRIHVPGATEVVVAVDGVNDHTAIHHDDRALMAVRAALEGRPPPCTSILEGLRAAVEPVLLSRVEGDLGEYLTTYLEVGR